IRPLPFHYTAPARKVERHALRAYAKRLLDGREVRFCKLSGEGTARKAVQLPGFFGSRNTGRELRLTIADQSARNSAYRTRGKSAAAAQFFAPHPAAVPPTAQSNRTCVELRTAPGTSSSEIPSTGKSTRCRNPHSGTASALRSIRLQERCAHTPARSPAADSFPSSRTLRTPRA